MASSVSAVSDIPMPARQSRNPAREQYHQEIEDLLNSFVGSYDASIWLDSNKYIDAMLKAGDIPRAFLILNRLVEEPDANLRLQHETIYNVVHHWIQLYTKQQRGKLTISSEQPIYPPLVVWNKIESYRRKGIQMEGISYHRILEGTALVKSKSLKNPHGPRLAETILEHMLELSRTENPMLRPSTHTFNAVITSWDYASASSPKTSTNKAAERSLELLDELKMLYAAGWGDEFMPDRTTYRRIMNIYARKGDAARCEDLLQECYEFWLDHRHESHNLRPTPSLFSLVLYAWSLSKDPGAAERATVILERMLEIERTGEIPKFQVTASCFNIAMVCWSRVRTRESALHVQQLFDQLVELSKGDPHKVPIGGSYTALINTWARHDPKRAENAFWEWTKQYDLGNCEMLFSSRLLGVLVAGWYNSKDPNRAERCNDLLQYVLKANLKSWEPSAVVFNMTINAYCQKKTIEGTEQAELLLQQLEVLCGTHPDLRTTVNSYAPIIHNWAAFGRVERAESLLRSWFEQAQRSGESNRGLRSKQIRLDTRTFNLVLKAWHAKSKLLPEAADRAEDLLLSMPRLGAKPSMSSFQHVLDCRRRSRSSAGGSVQPSHRVADLVELLDQEYKKGGLGVANEAYLALRRNLTLLAI